MKRLDLQKVNHVVKVGDECDDIEPNVTEDCLLCDNGEIIGFYIRDIRKYSMPLYNALGIANTEFRSKRVPKSMMTRSSALNARRDGGKGVEQFSTIIGSIPPKPHMRRAYPTRSSVHDVKSADLFVKAMIMACKHSENLIKLLAPSLYESQKQIISDKVPLKWRLGELFTSSISNFNIASSFHVDTANLKGCVNVILTKRNSSSGGNTTVPDYGATFYSDDNSMLVYPAWRNIHGVTPIKAHNDGGYRNSLVFYPLKAFNVK
tara:strand:+ start:5929 stop:6717 length:789 start_codon:yes stop_codon:yes gene_type:complete